MFYSLLLCSLSNRDVSPLEKSGFSPSDWPTTEMNSPRSMPDTTTAITRTRRYASPSSARMKPHYKGVKGQYIKSPNGLIRAHISHQKSSFTTEPRQTTPPPAAIPSIIRLAKLGHRNVARLISSLIQLKLNSRPLSRFRLRKYLFACRQYIYRVVSPINLRSRLFSYIRQSAMCLSSSLLEAS